MRIVELDLRKAAQTLVIGTSLVTGALPADAARPEPNAPVHVSLRDIGWQPITIEHHDSSHFEGIRYRDLAEVAAIHGQNDAWAGNPNNWEFIQSEFRFAAKLKERPDFEDVFVNIDANTVAEGFQLIDQPSDPRKWKEQRIVVGPGVDGPQNGIWVKGILVRRDKFPDALYKFVLSSRTAATVEEHKRGADHIVIGINGFRGKGDLREGFKRIRYSGGLAEVAQRYGGTADQWEWIPGEEEFAARLKGDPIEHYVPLLDVNSVVEGHQRLWSPKTIREQRFVISGNGQNGIFLVNGVFRRDERPDVAYKFILGTKSANTNSENRQRGTNIPVIGVNGFRGGEK